MGMIRDTVTAWYRSCRYIQITCHYPEDSSGITIYKVISHFPPFGPVNTHWTCVIESSVQLSASRRPRHSLKSSAPARRSSIIARCLPIQARDPIIKVEKAALTSGDGLSKRVSSNLKICAVSGQRWPEGTRGLTYSSPLGKISGMRWTA